MIFVFVCLTSLKMIISSPSLLLQMALFHSFSWLKVKVAQSCPNLCDPMYYTAQGILQARILEGVALPFSRGSSQPRDQTQVSCIAGEFSTAEPPGKPKNARVGSLSFLQQIFVTQGSNWGLLHYRWILYQLSHQGSPFQG